MFNEAKEETDAQKQSSVLQNNEAVELLRQILSIQQEQLDRLKKEEKQEYPVIEKEQKKQSNFIFQ